MFDQMIDDLKLCIVNDRLQLSYNNLVVNETESNFRYKMYRFSQVLSSVTVSGLVGEGE